MLLHQGRAGWLPQRSNSIPQANNKGKPPSKERRPKDNLRSGAGRSSRSKSSDRSGGGSNVSGGKTPKTLVLPDDNSDLEIRNRLYDKPREVVAETSQTTVVMLEQKPSSRRNSQNHTVPCDAKPKFTVKCKGCKHLVEGVTVRISGVDLGPTGSDGIATGNVPASDQRQTPAVTIPDSEDWRYQSDDGAVGTISIARYSTEEALLYVKCLVRPVVEVRLKKSGVEGAVVPGCR